MPASASPPFVSESALAPSPALPGEALSALRRRIAAIGADGQSRALAEEAARLPLGHAGADRALGGGLVTGALHEMRPAEPGDMAAATGFALAIAARLCRRDADEGASGGSPRSQAQASHASRTSHASRISHASRTWLWIRQDLAGRETGEPYGPGLAAFGVDPARLVLVAAADAREALRAAEEGLRCAPLGCVLLEPWGGARALDLTAMRRLALAAEASGVTLLMLRSGTHDAAAADGPGGAMTRWSVAGAPSLPGPALGALPGLGRPVFTTTLLRNRQPGRHGDGGRWTLEWNPDEHRLAPPAPLPGARPVAPLHGPPAAAVPAAQHPAGERRRAG